MGKSAKFNLSCNGKVPSHGATGQNRVRKRSRHPAPRDASHGGEAARIWGEVYGCKLFDKVLQRFTQKQVPCIKTRYLPVGQRSPDVV